MSIKPAYEELERRVQELEQLESKLKQIGKENLERFSTIFTSSPVSIAIVSLKNNQIIDVNDAWTRVTGLSREETVGRTTTELNVWANPGDRDRFINRLSEDGSVTDFDAPTRHKSGKVFDMLMSAKIIDYTDEKYLLVQGQDITGRKRAQEELARVNRVLQMLSNINQGLIRIRDEITLLNEACRILVEVGGYRMAWVGVAEQDDVKTMRPAAKAGFDAGYIGLIMADKERNNSPVGIAIRTGRPYIARNISENTVLSPWREYLIERGFKSVCALPLITEGRTFGVIGIYAGETDAFDAKEVEMLKELAGDLSFGITSLRTRAERDRMEESLRQSEELLRVTLTNILDPVFITDSHDKFTFICPNIENILGYSVEEIRAMDNISRLVGESLFDPEDLELHKEIINIETLIIDASGRQRVFLTNIKRVSIGEGTHLYTMHEITERKQMDEALRVNEQRYRMAQVISQSGNWEYNLQTTHFWGSDEAKRIYGFDPEQADFTADEVENCIPERERVHQALVDLIEAGKPYNLEFEIHPRNSSEPRFISSVAELKQDKHGNPIVAGVIQDITKRKRAEDLLKKREKEYRTLAENTPDFLTRFDTECRQIYISPSVSKAFGIPEEAFLGKTHLDPTMPGDPLNKEAMYQAVKRTLQFGEPFISELKWSTEKGETFIETHIVPEYDEAGKITSVLGIARDITKRKHAEEALLTSEEKYRTVVENLTDAVFLSAPDGRVFAANQGAREMLGMSESEIIASGRNGVVDINDPRLSAALEERAQTGRFRGELNFKKKDGTVFPVWISSSIFKDSHGDERTCILAHDISEQKKHEEELIRFQKLESLGLLAGGIAHDFNNILTTILGNVSLAGMLVKPEDEIYELLKETEKASIRAQMLTRQLLTFAKGGNPIKETASISDIIKESSLFVLRGSKSCCEFSIQDDLWPAEIDVGQISQVINNIILNARQAMPEGGIIRIAADNSIIADRSGLPLKPGKYIRISIADQGHGIAAKHLLNIFDPYFTTKQQGSGLGLAVTHSVIKKHDGYISVKSVLGVGTTFFIYLPASDKMIQKKKDDVILSGHGKLLVMDDEEPVRKTVGRILKQLGYETEFARDGDEAVLIYKRAMESGKPYKAVILDLTVPGGMGGKEAIKKLLEIDPEVKAVVSSGYSDDPVLSDFRTYGFKAALPKPFESLLLSKVLNEVLKKKASSRLQN